MLKPSHFILVDCNESQLLLYDDCMLQKKSYQISTACNGLGERKDSECTPRGCGDNTVFTARRPTGEIYSHDINDKYPERDWILGRILWLSGLERGFNRGGQFDTMHRYIYLHGSPSNRMKNPYGSRGCIRMHCHDVIALYNTIDIGCPIYISASIDKDVSYYRDQYDKLCVKAE